MSSACSFCFGKIEDQDKFCNGCGKSSFAYSRTHKSCTACGETCGAASIICPKCESTNFYQEIYSLYSAIDAGMDNESVFCDACLKKVNRPISEFAVTRGNQSIRRNQFSSVWKKDSQGNKVALCGFCERDKDLLSKYSDQERDYWENAPIHAVAIKKTTNFFKIALVVTVVVVVAAVVISLLIHNGSCVGPDGDYSNCYP